jgi:hypothetical protein
MCMKHAIYSYQTRGFDGLIFVVRTLNNMLDLLSNFVQLLVQSLHMTYLATYPKFSSISYLDFELQEKLVKLNLDFRLKSSSRK